MHGFSHLIIIIIIIIILIIHLFTQTNTRYVFRTFVKELQGYIVEK
jgi:hypothetical protein